MKQYQTSGFTLIEMLVVISVVVIMTTMSYTGYITQQQIVRVRLSVKEISQAIHEARNMAINGYVNNISDQKNQSVGIYFKKDENMLKFYGYDYDRTEFPVLEDRYLIHERPLQSNVVLGEIDTKENMMFFFWAISWEKKFFTFSGIYATHIEPIPTHISLSVSYKNISVSPFYKELTYYPQTNVVDY